MAGRRTHSDAYVGCKPCSRCKKIKPLSQYSRRSDGAGGGYRSACKPCIAAYSKDRYHGDPAIRAKHKVLRDRWRTENPNYLRENYLQNREERIAAAIAYARQNPKDPERRRQWERSWYAANRDERRAVKAAWEANNAEKVRENRRRGQARRRARMRGLPAEFYTIDQLLERDGTLCVLCGAELDLDSVHPEPLSPTVEHLECISWPNSAGDVLQNVAVSHWSCNNDRRTRPHPAAARKRAELLAAGD
jgi:hypothetical protein